MSQGDEVRKWLKRQYGARLVQILKDGSVLASGLSEQNAKQLAKDMGSEAVLSRPLGIIGGYAVRFPYFDVSGTR